MENPGYEHDLFKQWVLEQDIKVNGVAPARFVDRGVGLVAERDLKENEEIVVVPTSALLSTDSIVEEVKEAALTSGISVNGLLAMYLAITAQQDEDPYAEWRRTWPSRDDLAGLPILWPFSLRGLKKSGGSLGTWSPLPPSVNGEWSKEAIADSRLAGLATGSSRLEKQRRKLDKDWTRAKQLCEGRLEYNDYVYHWLLVNSRCFYFDGTEDKFESRDDQMAMCPFMDYMNHADSGCSVSFNDSGYTVTTNRAYAKGEELFVSYGGHDNDLLLTDYGFLLEPNAADSVPLDDIVLFGPSGVYKWKNLLNENNYFGDYKAGPDGVCYRTLMAAAVRVLDESDWIKVVNGTRDLTADEEQQANTIIEDKWLAIWTKEVERALGGWAQPSMQDPEQVPDIIRRLSVDRWRQIRDILSLASAAISSTKKS